jgi:arylsulfatase A-like enzyme
MRTFIASLIGLFISTCLASAADRPNILWITCEDISPNLGCYGDSYAKTPNLDAFATRAMRYTNAISNAPVCAPARTTIITGIYPPSSGAEHMRSQVRLPNGFRMFPHFLHDAGYYTTNNNKEDYNVEKPVRVWDDSSKKAHWKNRKKGQPFFAVFNHTISHESQIRNEIDKADQIHDPAKVHFPSYHPDAPEVRRDWTQYHDRITMMDKLAGANLAELKKAGLADDTIVFHFSDHGSGMPRSKRSACNSGLNVPFIVYFPEKWRHLAPKDYRPGGTSDRLISFIDLAPTVLSLAGIKQPEWMQGAPFCGQYEAPEPEFSFGFRGRMDERYDTVRSVRSKQYMYVRNYMPHRIAGQHNAYMFETPTTRVWHDLFVQGKLNEAQSLFWQPKAVEELYDLKADPDEVHNLAKLDQHQEVLAHMRDAQQQWEKRIKDVGLLSEWEFRERSKKSSPYEMGHDPKQFDCDAILAAANMASSMQADDLPKIVKLLDSADPGVRYWGAIGLLAQQKAGVTAGYDQLVTALKDDSPIVRITAAETLGRFGSAQDTAASLKVLLHYARPEANAFLSIAAWNALDYLDDRAKPAAREIRALSPDPIDEPPRYGGYGKRLKEETLRGLNKSLLPKESQP